MPRFHMHRICLLWSQLKISLLELFGSNSSNQNTITISLKMIAFVPPHCSSSSSSSYRAFFRSALIKKSLWQRWKGPHYSTPRLPSFAPPPHHYWKQTLDICFMKENIFVRHQRTLLWNLTSSETQCSEEWVSGNRGVTFSVATPKL